MLETTGEKGAPPRAPRLGLVGVGDAAGRIVDRLFASGAFTGAMMAAINTDGAALEAMSLPNRLQIGEDCGCRLGAGGDVSLGRRAAEDEAPLLEGLFGDVDLAVLLVCLGGGTGTGAGPVVLRAARAAGAHVVCVVSLPFSFEGRDRAEAALAGLGEMSDAELRVVMSLDRVGRMLGEEPLLEEAFGLADDLDMGVVRALWRILEAPGAMRMGPADLERAASVSGGSCAFGIGRGQGMDRAREAVEEALGSPLLGCGKTVSESGCILVSVAGRRDMRIQEVEDIAAAVSAAARPDARLFVGVATADGMDHEVEVALICAEEWAGATSAMWRDAGKQSGDLSVVPARQVGSESRVTRADDGGRAVQTTMGLDGPSRGRFQMVRATVLNGEDLDVPTFIRRNVSIER